MGMYATKSTVESGSTINAKWLKNNNYFSGYMAGQTEWNNGFGDKSSMDITVNTTNDYPYINLQYSTNKWNDERRNINYECPLVKVPCNLGGYRWAFKCPLSDNGRYCGKTVYTLYRANSDYFGCRNCSRVVYESQRQCRRRLEYLGKLFNLKEKIKDLHSSISKLHYRGQPTRKVRKLMMLLTAVNSTNSGLDRIMGYSES